MMMMNDGNDTNEQATFLCSNHRLQREFLCATESHFMHS